jgi:hypothetical protein
MGQHTLARQKNIKKKHLYNGKIWEKFKIGKFRAELASLIILWLILS